jgi:TolA protein
MRELNLQKTALLSAVLHVIVFSVTIVILKQSNHFVVPSPYTVSLVSPDAIGRGESAKVLRDTDNSIARTTMDMKSKRDAVEDTQYIKEKISALEAKKKIKKMVELRNMISLKAGAKDRSAQTASAPSLHARGDLFDDYYRKITKEIWQQWVYPSTSRKDIEAIISIRILKDGTALVQKVEKSSGNALFDKAALKALAKASPLEPPPYEMEIGVRFYP